MNELRNVLDPIRHWPLEAVHQLPFVLGRKEVYMLADLILIAVAKQMAAISEPSGRFNFLPSASLRGDGFSSCRAYECQVTKLDLLARYSALYADTVLIPVPHCMMSDNLYLARLHLSGCLLKLRVLWPLIEAGIVKLFIDEYPLCSHGKVYFERICRHLSQSVREFYNEKLEELTVVYRPKERKRPAAFEVIGPPDLIEHGSFMFTFTRGIPNWAPKRIGSVGGLPGTVLSKSTIKRNRVAIEIFEHLANDMVFQQLYGARYQARYLTDLPGETEFLELQRPEDNRFSNAAMVCRAIAHSVPVLGSLPLKTVLSIRMKETDSFELYRATLMRISRDYIQTGKRIAPAEADDIYTDILRPQLLKLKRVADSHRSERRKKTAATIAASAAALTLGVFGGLQTGILSSVLTAMGGSGLAKKRSPRSFRETRIRRKCKATNSIFC
jgi:hypothetical protein